MAYATVDDIAQRLGRDLDDQEVLIVRVRLDDVERLITAKSPDLLSKVEANLIEIGTVVMVEADAVLRLIKNPDGVSAETDGNYSYRIDSRVASGKLEILADEWGLLGVTAGMSVIRPVLRPYGSGLHFPATWYEIPEHPSYWW